MDEIFEIKNVGLENYLVYWVEDKAGIDEDALQILEESDAGVVETVVRLEKSGKIGFQYNIAYKATLKKFMAQTMGREQILKIFRTFLDALRFMRDNGIDETYLYLNTNYIFVDFMTHELSFICIPASDSRITSSTVAKFLREVLLEVTFQEEADILYIAELMLFLSQKKKTDVNEFEKLIEKLETETADAKKGHFVPAGKPEAMPFSKPEIMQNTVFQKAPVESGTTNTYVPKPISLDLARPVSGSLTGGLGGTKEANDATTVLTADSDFVQPPKPCLVRSGNREIIYIDKDTFKIGKSLSEVDYQIKDNQAISRIHAIIHKKNGVCYLLDNDSTNNTYINGSILKGDKEQMLLKGMKVAFADEEFTYELM